MTWLNIIVQGALLGGFYALFAIGLSMSFGIMRLVNIAHGDLIVLSAYVALVATWYTGFDPFLSLVIVLPVMFGLGYLLQRGLLNQTLSGGLLPPLPAPSPPSRGEREGPAPQAWEGEVG